MSFLSNGFGWLLGNNESSATGTVTSISTAGLISGGIITVSGTITTSVSTNKLVGRGTSGTGVMEEITLGTNLSLTGTTLNASGGGVTSVTGTTPIASSGGATPDISISQATTSTNGYLSSTDWNTFNNKGSGTVTSVSALTLGTTGTDLSSTIATGTTTPVITLNVPTASASNRGALSSADWTTFNNKGSGTVTSVTATSILTSSGGTTPNVSTLMATNKLLGRGTSLSGVMEEITLGTNLSLTGTTLNASGGGTVTSVTGTTPIASSGGATPDISISQATTSTNGYLSSTDWNTFNNKGSGTVTSVGGTLPISSSGGATPTISISQSSGATNGYLSSTDWNTFNNKQNTITLTTTGTSGVSTLIGATLNIPNYGSALTGYVPYTGATANVDLDAFKLNAQSLHAKGTGGLGHLGLKHQSASATASANEVSLFANSLGDLSWQNGNLYLSNFIISSNTANRSYTFPNNTGTIALTSDLTVFVTSVTSTSPISSSGGITPNISISQATTSTNGYLSSIDWNTFNNKGSGTVTSVSALTLGTTGTDLSSTIATGTTTPVITLNVPTASASNRGALSSADWTTFNNKGSGTITSVTGTLPIASSGGATPTISITQSSGATNGYLSSTDWTTFNNKGSGTVTSVSASVPTFLSIAGSPITTSGTLAISLSGTALPVLNGGTGVTTSTGSGNTVLSTSPTLVTPILGSASATALTFTSTAVSGLTINKLTTTQRQALTPVMGDVVYDTTIGTTCTYNGTFWQYTKEYYVTSNVTTTTTLASTITGLTTFILEANSTYNLNGEYVLTCNGAGGLKFGNTLPSGAVSTTYYNGVSTGVTGFQTGGVSNGNLNPTAFNRFSGASYFTFGGLITTVATAGSIDMQFASGIGGQTSTINGSFSPAYKSKITLTKIA